MIRHLIDAHLSADKKYIKCKGVQVNSECILNAERVKKYSSLIEITWVDYKKKIGVLLGCGNDSFASHIIRSLFPSPWFLTIFDLNKGNRLDIIIVKSKGNYIGVLLRHGNVSFTHQITYPTGASPLSATWLWKWVFCKTKDVCKWG